MTRPAVSVRLLSPWLHLRGASMTERLAKRPRPKKARVITKSEGQLRRCHFTADAHSDRTEALAKSRKRSSSLQERQDALNKRLCRERRGSNVSNEDRIALVTGVLISALRG